MKKNGLKKALLWLIRPKIWFSAFVGVLTLAFCAGAITFVFTDYNNTIPAFIIYGITALMFSYSVYISILYIPKIKARVSASLASNRLTGGLMADFGLRTLFFSGISFIINIGYAIFEGVLAVLSSSVWYGALSGYYLTLSCIRCYAVLSGGLDRRAAKKQSENEVGARAVKKHKVHLNCGIALVLLTFALSAAVLQMVSAGGGFRYGGLIIYAAAAYTFYKIIISVVNLVRAKRNFDPIVQSLKNINLADACVSVLALQTAMLAEFSDGKGEALYNALTATAVCMIIIAAGITMIIVSVRSIGKIKREELVNE